MPAKSPVCFLDRDGTLIHDRPGHYLRRPEQIRFYRTTFEALRLLKANGYKLVIISNQSGIGRGFLDEPMLSRIHTRLRTELARNRAGLDGIYYCPHHPKQRCSCRKPSPLLARRALRQMKLTLSCAVMIGDKKADIDLGRALGISTVFLKTGHGRSQREKFGRSIKPTHECHGILDAARWVVENIKAGTTK